LLAQEGLAAAIRKLAEERLAQDGLQVTIEITGDRSLPEPVEANLYRITQALNNSPATLGSPSIGPITPG
jgi:signal transduction histidine kinase